LKFNAKALRVEKVKKVEGVKGVEEVKEVEEVIRKCVLVVSKGIGPLRLFDL